MDQVWLPGRRNSIGLPCRARMIARTLSITIRQPITPSSSTYGETDRMVELADRAQRREQPHPGGGAGNAAGQQQAGERHVDRPPPPIADRPEHEDAAI